LPLPATLRVSLLALLTATACVAMGGLRYAPAGAHGIHLQTAVEVYSPPGPEGELTLARVREAGARLVRIVAPWSNVAPVSPPPGFEASNPDDPAYRWQEFDRLIGSAVAAKLEPILDITSPPSWAQAPPGAGPNSPDPLQLARFAAAAARRYDGSTPGLPRVRYWEVWNEPNASFFFEPQTRGRAIVSVGAYRAMLEDFGNAVHGVQADNVVIGGELFPNGVYTPSVFALAPLEFTRRIFCLSAGPHPHRLCHVRVPVDVWSVHPYTSGGPSTRPPNPDNIWISNLGSLVSTVRAAWRVGTLVSRQAPQTWVTEFSWDSDPPDPKGVPAKLEGRWVAEALYRSWAAGIHVFTWFLLRDQPLSVSPFQSGLYYACPGGLACDTPKPAEASFRFPFVALRRERRHVLLWGRTPGGRPARIQVQGLYRGRWRRMLRLRTDSDGIFTERARLPRWASTSDALLRALELGVGVDDSISPSFSLRVPANIHVTPFGS
jgi:hypothetical protein